MATAKAGKEANLQKNWAGLKDSRNVLSDDDLLGICRLSPDNSEVSPDLLADLRGAALLVGQRRPPQDAALEHAVALLTFILGGSSQYNPKHYPFGYSGPRYQSSGRIESDDLERIAKQIVGLIRIDVPPQQVTMDVHEAVMGALRFGFLETKEYDAWEPGMASGSGWRSAYKATPYGLAKARALIAKIQPIPEAAPPSIPPQPASANPPTQLEESAEVIEFLEKLKKLTPAEQSYLLRFYLFQYAQTYHNLVEAVANTPIGWVDMELNGWYLRIIKAIKMLLALPEFADFPDGFEPVAPNLFPSTDLDIGWEDCIGPPIFDFLGRAQAYMLDGSQISVTNQSVITTLKDACHANCIKASEVASRYRQRAHAEYQKMSERVMREAKRNQSPGPNSTPAENQAVNSTASCPPAPTPEVKPTEAKKVKSLTPGPSHPADEKYRWARQTELVKATNQVVGENALNPGVLSRACKNGEIITTGQSGRGAMVQVKNFLVWLGDKKELQRDELTQVRNAIIGEIDSRK